VNPRVRFDDEADAEYRLAGRWYETRREHLGLEFFNAVDAAIDRIVEVPQAGSPVRGLLPDLTVRRRAVMRFPTTSSTWCWRVTSGSSQLRTTAENQAIGTTASISRTLPSALLVFRSSVSCGFVSLTCAFTRGRSCSHRRPSGATRC